MLGGDKEPSETLSRRSAIRARLEDLDANHDGAPVSQVLPQLDSSHARHHHIVTAVTCLALCCRRD